MRSSAKLCVIPMQDYLALGNNCRINTPSTVGKNWKWESEYETVIIEIAEGNPGDDT